MAKYDVAIVGGGMAGLSVALHLCSRVDATILLIDKREIGDPTKTSPCTFLAIIEKYSLQEAVAQKYTKITYRSPTGVSASFKLDDPILVTLDYEKTCKILLDRIRSKGNVEIIENTNALNYRTQKKNFFRTKNLTLDLSNGETVFVDLLVDASGASFFAARNGAHARIPLPTFYSHCYGEFLEDCNIENPEEWCLIAGRKYGNGGGWFYPVGNRMARYGFATVTKSLNYPKAVVEKNFKTAHEELHPYNEMTRDAKTRRQEWGTIPLGVLKKFVFDRILIVGDAAAQATPWLCEGIRPALESGELCAQAVAKAYKQRKYSSKNLNKYQKAWDARNRQRYARARRKVLWFKNQEEWNNSVKWWKPLSASKIVSLIKEGA
jgi:flavin-dependent dehydrogenase